MAVVVGALVISVEWSAVAFGAVSIHSPKSARIGARVVVSATGMKSGRYTVVIERIAGPTTCLAAVGSADVVGGRLTVAGPVPARLSCHLGQNMPFGTIRVTSGSYWLVVGELVPPANFNYKASFAKTRISVVA